jgi:uroporphyrinogen decarboxylase
MTNSAIPSGVDSLQNDRYLRMLRGQSVDRTPLWVMRQAGRYLPEYRATRAVAGDFMSLCRNAELACEVTLQPLARYDLDAAILFSDILTIPDAMGLGLSFNAGEGPVFSKPLQSEADIDNLPILDPTAELQYVMNAVSTIRKALNGRVPLIGFSGSPWTLATYMVEGGSSKQFAKVKKLAYQSPVAMQKLMDNLSENVFVYLKAQVEAGAQALMIFDTWGGVLTPAQYQKISLDAMEKIVSRLKRDSVTANIPVTLFSKGVGEKQLVQLADLGNEAIGVDWTHALSDVRAATGDKVVLQGNLDPCVLYAQPEAIRQSVKAVLKSYGEHKATGGHIFNLGHGIHPDIPPEKVSVLVEAVKEFSSQYVC